MECDQQQQIICNGQFKAIVARLDQSDKNVHEKLDALDEAIRGNGKPGIQTRLDRLEQERLVRNKVLWFLLGIAGTIGGALLTALILRWL